MVGSLLSGGTVENCYSSVAMYSTATTTGGIVGIVIGGDETVTIENCVYAGAMKREGSGTAIQAGGIVGRVEKNATLTVSGCKNYAKIVSGTYRLGGILGLTLNSTINVVNCVNYGDLQSTASNVSGGGIGGILGQHFINDGSTTKAANLSGCANYGNIQGVSTASNPVGGIVGNTSKTQSILNCANYGDITGYFASGIITESVATTIANCYVQGKRTESNSTKGRMIVGSATSHSTIKNCIGVTSGSLYADDGTTTATSNYAYPADDAALTNGTALAILNTDNDGVWVQGATAPFLKILAAQVAIEGATLSLDDTMTLKLFVKASSAAKIDGLKSIMVNDGTKDGNYKGTLDAKTGNYVFEIAGLEAKDMGTAKTYTVKYTLTSDTANPIVCDTGVTYSPLQYAINMYNKNKQDGKVVDANFAALLTSMVRYMDAAGATGAKSAFSTETEYTFDDTAVDTAYAAIVAKDAESQFSFPADTAVMSATLTSGITLTIAPATGKTFTEVTVKIGNTGLEVKEVDGKWRVTGINPGDLYNELTFTIKTSDGTVTGTYSVARYLNSYMDADLENETTIETLAKATALYMDAFITYKTLG